MNLFRKQKWTHRHRRQTYVYLRGKGLSVWDQQILTTIYKTDKQQGPTAYSTEIYIQDPIINHNGKEKNMCTYN